MLIKVLQYIVMENVSLGMNHGVSFYRVHMPFHRNQIVFIGTLCIKIT